jgi:hypothetical protein
LSLLRWQRVAMAVQSNSLGVWKTSRRNQEKASEVILNVVSECGGRQQGASI